MESRDPVRHIQPTGDRLLVQRAPHVRQVGTLFVVGGKREQLAVSKVLCRGPDVKAKPWHLAPGDYIVHPLVSGVKYDPSLGRLDNDADLLFLHEHEILCCVDPGSIVEGEVNFDATGTADLTRK